MHVECVCVCVSMHACVCMCKKLVQMPKSQELAVFLLTKQITLLLAYARWVTKFRTKITKITVYVNIMRINNNVIYKCLLLPPPHNALRSYKCLLLPPPHNALYSYSTHHHRSSYHHHRTSHNRHSSIPL